MSKLVHERRLAAIMFTDIVGYTSLMGSDEEKAFKTLAENRTIHLKHFSSYNGTLIKELGDGILASFNVASDAVRCGIAIQKSSKEAGIPLKIGAHIGEMVFSGSDVHGDGVNIASRLQENSKEGSFNISGSVYREIKNKSDIKTTYLGERQFKNVSEVIKVYEVIQAINQPAFTTNVIKDRTNSIAVLPFVNMSNDPEQEFFCDGMSEEIINALTHVESLKVIARTSAFMFKDRNEDMRDIGRKLGVDTLLEGSVRKSGERVRITAQLINTSDGTHIWSERFDRNIEDVFAIQDEISLAIVENLRVKLLGNQRAAIVKRGTDNIDAHLHYLKGRRARQQKNEVSFKTALLDLEKAVELDPAYAAAYADIAFTYVLMGWFCYVPLNEDIKDKITFYVNKALDLDNNLAEAYTSMALAWELFDLNYINAEEYARRAVELNPGNSEAMQEYGFILGRMGRYEDALEKMESTLPMDPLATNVYNGLGHLHFYKGDFNAAIKQFRKILTLDPSFYISRFVTALSLTEIGKYEDALKELGKCQQVNIAVLSHTGYLLGLMGNIEEANRIVQEVKNAYRDDLVYEYLMGLIYIGMGDHKNAHLWFHKSQDKYGFVYRDRTIGTDYRLKEVRKDPRYADLNFK